MRPELSLDGAPKAHPQRPLGSRGLTATRTLLALAAAGVSASCAPGTTCGPGTVDNNGTCVLASPVTCGSGTVNDGGSCVPEVEETPDAGAPACDPACSAEEVCDPSGVCVPAPKPSTWTCGPSKYRDGAICDCGCGALDPDCAVTGAPVTGCLSGACQADGACAPCTPDCAGKACGDDGCGGNCGSCFDPSKLFCIDGACAACTPECSGKNCGLDGCGGSCGSCGQGQLCTLGKCGAPPPEASCSGRCGGVAPSGCSCQGGCDRIGTCCADVDLCGCLPSCGQKECGDDGCGGVCGACDVDQLCVAGECKANVCQPDPCSGHGTCHLPDATCTCETGYAGAHCSQCDSGYAGYPDCVPASCAAAATSCSGHGACVPASGACACDAGFTGAKCDACLTGHGTYPNCTP